MSMMFDTPASIAFFQLAARKGALAMELRGMKRRGRSVYSICKSEYGLRGNRESVYEQMCALVEATIAAKSEGRVNDESSSALDGVSAAVYNESVEVV